MVLTKIKEKLKNAWRRIENQDKKILFTLGISSILGVGMALATNDSLSDNSFETLPNVRKLSDLYKITYNQWSEIEIPKINSPEVKLKRWGDEAWLKVEFPTTRRTNPVQQDGKLKWIDANQEIHFYPLEPTEENELGGFEYEIILKEKPITNQIVLNIETQGLRFFYQPPLTQREIEDWNAFRPENVVGSYAVYHIEDKFWHLNQESAEKYRSGIAFHIYRPKVKDNSGKEVWADLLIDEQAGTLTITVPQDFLDRAVYPVTIDPTFGYTTVGASNGTITTNQWVGTLGSPASNGTGDSISLYTWTDGGTANYKGVLVEASGMTIVTDGIGGAATITATPQWATSTFATAPSITAGTNNYYVGEVVNTGGNTTRLAYNVGGLANQTRLDSTNSYDSPSDPTDATNQQVYFSGYCTYEVAPSYTCDVTGTEISFAIVDNTAVYPNVSASTTVTVTSGSAIYLKVYDEGKGVAQPGLYGSTTTNADLIGSADATFGNTATLVAGTEGYGIHAATTTNGSGNELVLSFRYGTSNQEGSVGATYVGGLEVGSGASVALASTTAGTTTGREAVVSYYVAVSNSNDAGDYKDRIHFLCTPSP